VVKTVEKYNGWVQQSKLPKCFFYATPGATLPAPMVEWCLQNLSSFEAVDIGQGTHFLQEDQPHLIGSKLATWYRAVDESESASSRRIA
jgi:haloalkane dehalogenase